VLDASVEEEGEVALFLVASAVKSVDSGGSDRLSTIAAPTTAGGLTAHGQACGARSQRLPSQDSASESL
jgi:hypothetical protein